MRKKLALLLLVISIIGMVCLVSGQEKLYSELCITEDEMQEIVASRAEAADSLYTNVSFNEYELMLDAAGDRLFYSLIENSSNAYNPIVEYTSKKENVQIAIVGNAITDEVIANGEEFGILFYTDEEYEYVKLVFTTLPLLSVDYNGELDEYTGNTEHMNFRLFDNRKEATQRVLDAEGEIRIRGRSSRFFPKKGYRLTLYTESVGNNKRELDSSLLGMRQDGDWLLYAAYNDAEKIRNVFSSNIWKESCAENNLCGVDNGMEYKYVELFVKGQYWGLYALGYPIDSLQLQMTEGEYMYTKQNPEVSEYDIDYNADGPVYAYEIQELGANTVEEWEPLKKYYTAMLYGNDNYASLREMADLRNHIDIYLFLNMIQGVDHANIRGKNIVFNLYMTNKFIDNGDSEIMLYAPWDMDRSWGIGFPDDNIYVTVDQNILMQTNIVHLLLEQGDAEMEKMLVQRYEELRESTWSDEHLTDMLNMYEKQIFDSGAYVRDRVRWPNGSYSDNQNKLTSFKDYVLERMEYMDLYIQQYQ